MKVLIDTSVWSLALRRRRPEREVAIRTELARLIAEFEVAIIGPIRQELLSGIREEKQYLALQENLRAFPDVRWKPPSTKWRRGVSMSVGQEAYKD